MQVGSVGGIEEASRVCAWRGGAQRDQEGKQGLQGGWWAPGGFGGMRGLAQSAGGV